MKHTDKSAAPEKQHLLAEPVAAYLVVNAAGGVVNYGVYALCIFLSEFVRHHLYLGVAAGSVAGLAVNFTASRYLISAGSRPDFPRPI